ncbi:MULTISPECIES: cupin domain-containing protein [unclassified Bradyrhizobium]|uniref:cupin domain-containing protein n=1 Tax=unclassified Bradyrhizobium TaxID=2631580 RepID=UPI0003F60955|nr:MULTISPECIES: cupin domain-containing protein [unclassified Bradyrhizobium]QIG99021.1 cupin domain-containing protein [Bradyrhizobium sp. 6(2017)]
MNTLWTTLLACAALATPAMAQSVTPKFEHAITNIPGKSLIAVEVNFPPGEPSAPHHHAKSAFLYVYILQGAIESQLEGEAAHVYRAGDSFFEPPGAHHVLGRNASATEPAKRLAVFVVDSNDKALTVFDKEGHKQ